MQNSTCPCELLLRARLVPDRAGADTQVIAHVALAQLRGLPGAGAEAAACDALIVPVVTGHPDWQVIDQILDICLAAAGHAAAPGPRALRPMSPAAHQTLRMQVARLAIDLVSGQAGIAGFLRTRLLGAPCNSASLPLDIGYADSIPASIRRAVALRDKRCAWPRCGRPASVCDVDHIVHKRDGGTTSVSSCVLLCQFHHDICIHR
jgi:hypothetical protein